MLASNTVRRCGLQVAGLWIVLAILVGIALIVAAITLIFRRTNKGRAEIAKSVIERRMSEASGHSGINGSLAKAVSFMEDGKAGSGAASAEEVLALRRELAQTQAMVAEVLTLVKKLN